VGIGRECGQPRVLQRMPDGEMVEALIPIVGQAEKLVYGVKVEVAVAQASRIDTIPCSSPSTFSSEEPCRR